MKISDFIFKIAGGLFFSIVYLTISYLCSYFSIFWGWEGIGTIWFIIGFTTYCILGEQVDTNINVWGCFLFIILPFSFKFVPQLWVYIVLNTIVCLNIIITCIMKE